MRTRIQLRWLGPFRFGGVVNVPPDASGIYAWTLPTENGRMVAYVGQAKSILERTAQHAYSLLGGLYQIYDPRQLRLGNREKPIYKRENTATVLTRFVNEHTSLSAVARENLTMYEVFWATVAGDNSLLCSIESAFISCIRAHEDSTIQKYLENGQVSRRRAKALAVRCVSTWPDGVAFAGVCPEVDYGELPHH